MRLLAPDSHGQCDFWRPKVTGTASFGAQKSPALRLVGAGTPGTVIVWSRSEAQWAGGRCWQEHARHTVGHVRDPYTQSRRPSVPMPANATCCQHARCMQRFSSGVCTARRRACPYPPCKHRLSTPWFPHRPGARWGLTDGPSSGPPRKPSSKTAIGVCMCTSVWQPASKTRFLPGCRLNY